MTIRLSQSHPSALREPTANRAQRKHYCTFNQDMQWSFNNSTNRVWGYLSGLHPSSNIGYDSGTKTVTFNPESISRSERSSL